MTHCYAQGFTTLAAHTPGQTILVHIESTAKAQTLSKTWWDLKQLL